MCVSIFGDDLYVTNAWNHNSDMDKLGATILLYKRKYRCFACFLWTTTCTRPFFVLRMIPVLISQIPSRVYRAPRDCLHVQWTFGLGRYRNNAARETIDIWRSIPGYGWPPFEEKHHHHHRRHHHHHHHHQQQQQQQQQRRQRAFNERPLGEKPRVRTHAPPLPQAMCLFGGAWREIKKQMEIMLGWWKWEPLASFTNICWKNWVLY